MAISKSMSQKLNEQVTAEFFASQLYLSMACMFDAMSLKMLSKYFLRQAEEERQHAMKFIGYLQDVGDEVRLGAIPEPQQKWPTVVDAIGAAVEHEKKVTGMINDLVALAEEEKDYATRNFLNWFVEEQVEEEDSIGYLHDLAKMAGDHFVQLEGVVSHLNKD